MSQELTFRHWLVDKLVGIWKDIRNVRRNWLSMTDGEKGFIQVLCGIVLGILSLAVLLPVSNTVGMAYPFTIMIGGAWVISAVYLILHGWYLLEVKAK